MIEKGKREKMFEGLRFEVRWRLEVQGQLLKYGNTLYNSDC